MKEKISNHDIIMDQKRKDEEKESAFLTDLPIEHELPK